jgi:hypothetical protein
LRTDRKLRPSFERACAALRWVEIAHLLAGNLAIVSAPVDVELVGKHVFDLRRECMCRVVRRLGVVSRFAVVAWLTSAFVGFVKSIDGDLRDPRLFAQVRPRSPRAWRLGTRSAGRASARRRYANHRVLSCQSPEVGYRWWSTVSMTIFSGR